MEKFKLNKIGTEHDGKYSVYENPDKELVAKIKAVEKPKTFKYSNKGIAKVLQELGNNDWLCVYENGDHFVVKTDEIEKARRETYMLLINELFPVSDYFNEHFGRFYNKNVAIELTGVHVGRKNWGGRLFNFYEGVNPIFMELKWNSKDTDEKFIFNQETYFTSGHLYFNEDGNYVNRDYNLDFSRYTTEKPSRQPEDFMKELEDYFNKFESLEYKGDKWFTPDTAFSFVIEENGFEILKIKKKSEGKYFMKGLPLITKPTTTQTVEPSHILDRIREHVKTVDEISDDYNARWKRDYDENEKK